MEKIDIQWALIHVGLIIVVMMVINKIDVLKKLILGGK